MKYYASQYKSEMQKVCGRPDEKKSEVCGLKQ